MCDLIIGWIHHLMGKDNDLLDDAGSLVLEELLNDISANVTGPNDGEVRMSRHESTLSTVCVTLAGNTIYPPSRTTLRVRFIARPGFGFELHLHTSAHYLRACP